MTRSCNEIQEAIAWGKDLTEAEQSHALSCQSCSEAAMEFAQLDAAMKDHLRVRVPDRFADQVMSRIMKDWATSFSERFLFLINLRAVQFGLVAIGALMTLGNLIRFVFAVILPVSA
jgi:hypothetical protein